VIRGLMSVEEWVCLAPFVIESGARSGRRPRDHRLVLNGIFFGLHGRALHGAICMSILANGRRFTASSGAGRCPACGSCYSKLTMTAAVATPACR
jgi:hypothetical protein